VGLYMNPPERALVLCVDEKSQIQALDRTAPLLPMDRADRAPHTRLCAPRNHQPVCSAGYQDRQDHRPEPATPSLRRVPQLSRLPSRRMCPRTGHHLIMDNYGTHKTSMIRNWLPSDRASMSTSHPPRLMAELGERWFALLTERQLDAGVSPALPKS